MPEAHNERDHALYGPSSAKDWLACPGRIDMKAKAEAEGKIIKTTKPAADRGTLCHMLCEMALDKQRFSVKKRVNQVSIKDALGKDVYFTEDLVKPVEDAVKEARAFMKLFPDAEWKQEIRLDPLEKYADMWGTVDLVGTEMGLRVIVADFKFGNHEVSSEDNKQLMIYGLLAAQTCFVDHNNPDHEIIGKIIQPVKKNGNAKDYTVYNHHDLNNLLAAVDMAMSSDDLCPSEENCRWCAGKSVCPEKNKVMAETAQALFEPVDVDVNQNPSEVGGTPVFSNLTETGTKKSEDVTESDTNKSTPAKLNMTELPAPADVEPDMVQHIIAFEKVFRSWFKEFMLHTQAAAVEDGAMPGTKVVAGKKGNRKWTGTEEEVIDCLTMMYARNRDDVVDMKVKTPSKMAKVLNEHEMLMLEKQGWITQEDGKPTLALEDDKRKDYDITKLFSPVGE